MTTGRYSINYKSKKVDLNNIDFKKISVEVKETGAKRKLMPLKYDKKPFFVETPILRANFGSFADKDTDKDQPMDDNTAHDITVQLGTEEQRKQNPLQEKFYKLLQSLEQMGVKFVKENNEEFQGKNAKKKDPESFPVKLGSIIRFNPDSKDLHGNPYSPTIKFKIEKKDGSFQDRGFSKKVIGKDKVPRDLTDQTEKEQVMRSIKGKEVKCMIRLNYFIYLNGNLYLTANIEQILVRSNEEEQSRLSDDEDNQDITSSTESEESEVESDNEPEQKINAQDFQNKVKIEEQVDEDKVKKEESSDENEFEQVQQTPTQQKKGRKPGAKQTK